MKKWETISFPKFVDERGTLVPFEFDKSFPFPVKRTYLVTGAQNQRRGGHAHKIESELFVVIAGSVEVEIHDGENPQKILLNQSHEGLLVRPYCWHEFYNFSPDAVMLCFSSTHYLPGEENYIESMADFLAA